MRGGKEERRKGERERRESAREETIEFYDLLSSEDHAQWLICNYSVK